MIVITPKMSIMSIGCSIICCKCSPSEANIILVCPNIKANLITNLNTYWIKGHQDQGDDESILHKAHLPEIQLNIECGEIVGEANVTQFPIGVDTYPKSGAELVINCAWVTAK